MEPNLSTVRARRAQLAKLRKALDDEDHDLEVAEHVLTRLAATPSAPTPAPSPSPGVTINVIPNPNGAQPVTQKDLILATLRTVSEPWVESSRDLQAEIERIHGVRIKDGSLLPQLTQLKNDGIIRRDAHHRIALAERISQTTALDFFKSKHSPKESGHGG